MVSGKVMNGSIPATDHKKYVRYAASMMNAAWARLMMLRMPHTSENPSPIRARTQPWSTPFRTCWTKSTQALATAPARKRPQRLALGHVGRPDRNSAAVLPLLDRHRLGHVDTALIELDLSVAGREVQFGDLVAHLVGTGPTSCLGACGDSGVASCRLCALFRGLVVKRLRAHRVVCLGSLDQAASC